MISEAKNNLKKRYKIQWIYDDGYGREAPILVTHKVIETPAQKTWNNIVDMVDLSFRLKEI